MLKILGGTEGTLKFLSEDWDLLDLLASLSIELSRIAVKSSFGCSCEVVALETAGVFLWRAPTRFHHEKWIQHMKDPSRKKSNLPRICGPSSDLVQAGTVLGELSESMPFIEKKSGTYTAHSFMAGIVQLSKAVEPGKESARLNIRGAMSAPPSDGKQNAKAGIATACFQCGKIGDLKRCSKCKIAYYCSSVCQRAAMGMHKLYCR